MFTLLIFFVTLGVLVLSHEFGHFISAKRSGAKVEEFGFGFPPRLFGVKRGETFYSFNLIPIGGFVKILGEDGSGTHDPRSFVSLTFPRKILVLLSGVLMNVLLAIIVTSFLYVYGAPTVLDSSQLPKDAIVQQTGIEIFGIVADSPAAKSGIHPGDIIVSVDGNSIASVDDLQNYNQAHVGIEEKVIVRRDKIDVPVTIAPQDSGNGAIWGVQLAQTGIVRYPWYRALWLGFQSTFETLWQIIIGFAQLLKSLVATRHVTSDVSGPIGIAVLTGQVAHLGLSYFLQFLAYLSLNLAFINALPIPALDGGRTLIVLLERIFRKKLNHVLERRINAIGYSALLLFIVFITFRDVVRYGTPFFDFVSRLFR